MRHLSIILVLLLTVCSVRTGATVFYSHDDGPWDGIDWSTEVMPEEGDTLVIRTTVVIDRNLPPVTIFVAPDGIVHLRQGESWIERLVNNGRVFVDRGAAIVVDGAVVNNGLLDGDGVVKLVAAGATISGRGSFGHVVIAPPSGGRIVSMSSIRLRSLSLAGDVGVDIGPFDLEVDGAYSAASLDPRYGLFASTGIVTFNGPVFGSVSGRVIVGNLPGYHQSKRGGYPTVSGSLGGNGCYVRFTASRRLNLAVLSGTIVIDSAVVLQSGGIGDGGSNSMTGSILNNGLLRGTDPGHRLVVDGDLVNNGSIANITISLRGDRPLVEATSGEWDPGISLEYLGPSGGMLEVKGNITVSRLIVGPISDNDSNVVIRSSNGTLVIRHDFRSAIARDCRVEADSTVRIRGSADGMVRAGVLFEGFRGRSRAGRYGGPGMDVRIAVPTRINGELRCDGRLVTDRATTLDVVGLLDCRDTALFRGAVSITTGGEARFLRDTRFEREVSGGGVVGCVGNLSLSIVAGIVDSVTLAAGSPGLPVAVVLDGNIRLPRLHLIARSTLATSSGGQPEILDRFTYDLTVPAGFSLVALAARPGIPLATGFFPGATSALYRFEGAYLATDSVKVGEGYFVRYDAPTALTHIGRYITLPLEIPLRSGWNLVGGASIPASVADISVAGTALESGFLPTSGSTTPVSIIEPGVGYWVRATGAGVLTLNPAP